MNKINPNSTWAKLPRWKKRLEGFKCYIVALATCLIWPEVTDSAMYDSLKTQFINTSSTEHQGDEIQQKDAADGEGRDLKNGVDKEKCLELADRLFR